MKKFFLLFSILFFIVIGSVFYSRFSSKNVSRPTSATPTQTPSQANEVTLSIDFGDSKPLIFAEIPTSETTAFNLLKDIADQKKIELVTKDYSFGIFVQSINGKVSSQEKSWIYFVNGQGGNVAADKYAVKPGDKVEWKYLTPSE